MKFEHPRSAVVITVLLLLLAALLAGCRSQQEQSSAEDAQPSEAVTDSSPPPLAGTSWIVESMGEGTDKVESLPDVDSTLGFLVDRYGGNGGCDFYVGVYGVDGAQLRLETPAQTADSCADSPASLTQENAFLSGLATADHYAVADGKLEIFASNGQLMVTLAPMEPAPLDGTMWSLQFVNAETQWEPLIEGTQITLRIEDGRLSGSAGCNDYSASVVEEAGEITITDLSATEKACLEPDGVMEQETMYLSLLEQAALVRQFPLSLELLDGDGLSLLLYDTTVAVPE